MTTNLTGDQLAAIRTRAENAADSSFAHLEFLAHAPADVLALLDMVERLRNGVAAAVEGGFEEYGGDFNEVHYRVYLSERRGPTTICVQEFDYYSYEADRFLTETRHANEASAERDLALYLARA
jgi:hypothetical protein